MTAYIAGHLLKLRQIERLSIQIFHVRKEQDRLPQKFADNIDLAGAFTRHRCRVVSELYFVDPVVNLTPAATAGGDHKKKTNQDQRHHAEPAKTACPMTLAKAKNREN